MLMNSEIYEIQHYKIWYPLTLAGTGGIDATLPKVFLRWPKNGGAQRPPPKFSIAYGAFFAHLLVKQIWSGLVRSRSYDVISGTTSDRFFGKSHRLC